MAPCVCVRARAYVRACVRTCVRVCVCARALTRYELDRTSLCVPLHELRYKTGEQFTYVCECAATDFLVGNLRCRLKQCTPLNFCIVMRNYVCCFSIRRFPPSLNGKSSYTHTVIVTVSRFVHWLWFSVATGAWSRHFTVGLLPEHNRSVVPGTDCRLNQRPPT